MIYLLIIFVISFISVQIYRYYDLKKQSTILSIKESIMLTDFPILTFTSKGRKIKLLLDTGSNRNIIDENLLSELDVTGTSSDDTTIHSMGGKSKLSSKVILSFKYDSLDFKDSFLAADISGNIAAIKELSGVEVNGILGTPFMTKYKYIIDLDNLKVRIK